MSGNSFTLSTTNRGFALMEFHDRYAEKCSLQKSSLAFEDCIWLGVNAPETLPDGSVSGRMHLTRWHAAILSSALAHFALTGELPTGRAA